MDFKDVAEQAYKNGYEDGKKETAKEIYDLCCEHGTTYIKKYLRNKYGVKPNDDENKCKYYNNGHCDGARLAPHCYCYGYKSLCTEYPETRREYQKLFKE